MRTSQWHFGGVAGRTVARLMADLPEIGTCNGKAIATLVGLAPMANDSAQRKGHRVTDGGRRRGPFHPVTRRQRSGPLP